MSGWDGSKLLARAILRDRVARRKVIGRLLVVALVMMASGLWMIDGWLVGNPWGFLLWWAACALITCLVMMFALYDVLAVIREEREKSRLKSDKHDCKHDL